MTLIIDGAARGEILADEAQTLTGMVTGFVEALRVNELEERLSELEAWRAESRASTQGNRFDA
jgi:hypothetical protein